MKKLTLQLLLIFTICAGIFLASRAFVQSINLSLKNQTECETNNSDNIQADINIKLLGRHLLDLNR